jgi:hypothetical protein
LINLTDRVESVLVFDKRPKKDLPDDSPLKANV